MVSDESFFVINGDVITNIDLTKLSKKQLSSNLANGGWNSIIEKYNLNIVDTVSLPTVWTFDQIIETPYIYTKFK